MGSNPLNLTQAVRVGIVTGQLSHGGAERQLVLLAKGLKQYSDFVPVVFCMSHAIEPYGSILTAAAVEWYAPPMSSNSSTRRLFWLIRKLTAFRYSLVYGVLNTGNIYGGAAAIAAGLPFIGSIRSANSNLPVLTKTLSGLFCRNAQFVIANSPSCALSLRDDLHVQHGRVHIIPNAVELPNATTDARYRMRQKWNIPENAFLIGTVANLKPEKRVRFFLDIATILYKQEMTSLYFVWVGEGPEGAHLNKYLAQLHPALVDRLRFPGATLDIADCLAAMDAFILTSAYEGLPSALLEAMAAGLPCMGTDVPGIRDVVEGSPDKQIGILGDADTPVNFAMRLLDLIQTPIRMQELGSNAKQHVLENYGLKVMVSRFSEAFNNALNFDVKRGAYLS